MISEFHSKPLSNNFCAIIIDYHRETNFDLSLSDFFTSYDRVNYFFLCASASRENTLCQGIFSCLQIVALSASHGTKPVQILLQLAVIHFLTVHSTKTS